MKNSRAMFSEAKALAIKLGPRQFRSAMGYALTRQEIVKLYLMEGFSRDNKALNNHLNIWKELESIKEFPFGPEKENVYFFRLQRPEDNPHIQKLKIAFPDLANEEDNGVIFA